MDKQAFNYAFDLGIREVAIELEKQAEGIFIKTRSSEGRGKIAKKIDKALWGIAGAGILGTLGGGAAAKLSNVVGLSKLVGKAKFAKNLGQKMVKEDASSKASAYKIAKDHWDRWADHRRVFPTNEISPVLKKAISLEDASKEVGSLAVGTVAGIAAGAYGGMQASKIGDTYAVPIILPIVD